IVIAGSAYNGSNSDFAVVRYNSNGSLDNSFDTDGKLTVAVGSGDDLGSSVALQVDGKIVVAGTSASGASNDFAVVRCNTDGSLDTSFDTDGKLTTPIGSGDDSGYSVAVQADGRIVVAGSSSNGSNLDFAVVRYKANGNLDRLSDGTGKITTAFGISDDQG